MKGKSQEIFILLFVFLLTGCAALNRKMDDIREKREKEIQEGYESIKQMVFSGLYQFTATRAHAVGQYSRDLSGVGYYLAVNYYDVKADLPFFGQQYMADNQRGSGILIEGKMENIMIEESDSRHRVLIRFNVDSRSDNYLINLDIGPSGEANLTISSSRRSTITFRGEVTPIEPEEE